MEKGILFEERTGWALWVHPLVWLCSLSAVFPLLELWNGNGWGGESGMPVWVAVLCILLGFGIPGMIYGFMGQLRTRVTQEGVELRWGFLDLIKKQIPYGEVDTAEAVTYSPIGEFGGWGIRAGRKGKRAWTTRGNRAMVLNLTDGTRFYVGSDKPERILQWVTSAMKRREE